MSCPSTAPCSIPNSPVGKPDKNPDPLELARAGDEEALDKVLGYVIAPVFDLALHRYRQPERAERAAIDGLRALATGIRSGGPESSPVAEAVRGVLGSGDEAAPLPDGTALDRAMAALDADQRRALLASLACDLEDDELAYALQVDGRTALDLCAAGLRAADLDRNALREAMDARAAQTPLPQGLIDRALA